MLTLDANIWIAAYDPRDAFHRQSLAFLVEVTGRRMRLYAPAFLAVETACAVARRAQSPAAGELAMKELCAHPLLQLQPLDERLLNTAAQIGARLFLRGADALYAATAAIRNTPLVSWDAELIRRVNAVTPTDWLAANPSTS